MIAIQGRIPGEWFEQPWGADGPPLDRYHCIEFRPPGGGGGGREPRPRPDPPDMDALFPRPSPERRMLTAAPTHLGGRPVATVPADPTRELL